MLFWSAHIYTYFVCMSVVVSQKYTIKYHFDFYDFHIATVEKCNTINGKRQMQQRRRRRSRKKQLQILLTTCTCYKETTLRPKRCAGTLKYTVCTINFSVFLLELSTFMFDLRVLVFAYGTFLTISTFFIMVISEFSDTTVCVVVTCYEFTHIL